jgi:predicted NUDIX family NTP pyrophosphohydrolase
MQKQSAGILLYKRTDNGIEMLLVHPGGPYWAKKDAGVWSIPKGEFAKGEEPLSAAVREFSEELGYPLPEGELVPLGQARQSSGKIVHAWALQADLDASTVKSNTFTMEWPPKSGRQQEFPEIDKAEWFTLAAAPQKLARGQLPLLKMLAEYLGVTIDETQPGSPQSSLF